MKTIQRKLLLQDSLYSDSDYIDCKGGESMENFGDVLEILFKLIVLPIIPLVVLYVKTFIQMKIEELQEKINNEKVDKYLALANDILQKVVTEVTQVYVDDLKATNSFDKEAQKKAFMLAKEKFELIATDEVKNVINEVMGDYDAFIQSAIETLVNQQK